MQRLLEGYRRFRTKPWRDQPAQSPRSMVVACVDSRVDPASIFDAAPGEILTIRNVANLVPPYAPDAGYHGTSAALEFGVRVLEVEHVIVLGHSMCGGVKALLEGSPDVAREFVTPWMSIAEPARARAQSASTPEERQRVCEHGVIQVSLDNLLTFPWIAERVAAGKLALHGAWFDVRSGELSLL